MKTFIAFLILLSSAQASCNLDVFLIEYPNIKVNSGDRSKLHNKRVGGATYSWHLRNCGARDVSKEGMMDVDSFVINALLSGFRVIEYNKHIHIDNGESKYLKGKYNGKP